MRGQWNVRMARMPTPVQDAPWVMRARTAIFANGANTASSAISDDGNVFAIGATATDYIRIAEWNGTKWVKRTSPTTTLAAHSIGMSGDGKRIIATSSATSSNPVRIFNWSGTAWTGANLVGGPTVGTAAVGMSGDGNKVVVGAAGSSNSTAFSVYDYANSVWTRRALPPSLSLGAFITAQISDDGNVVACQRESSPHLTCADWNGEAWSYRPYPPLPVGSVSFCSLSADGRTIVCWSSSASPRLMVFYWNGAGWVNRSIPDGVHGISSVLGISMSADGMTVAVGVSPASAESVAVFLFNASGQAWSKAQSVDFDKALGAMMRPQVSRDGNHIGAIAANTPYYCVFDKVLN